MPVPPGMVPLRMTNDFSFYLLPDGANVCAVHVASAEQAQRVTGRVEGYVPVYDHPDSPVEWGALDPAQVEAYKPLSEAEARERHPALFRRLDENAQSEQ